MADRKKVLIVGDWLVDELWVVGRHRSESASRAGHNHSRALWAGDCSVRTLCGAGQSATILYNAKDRNKFLFDIVGLGLWHPDDKEELKCMLDPQSNVGKTPHRLVTTSGGAPEALDRAELIDLVSPSFAESLGTTRVIRIFEQRRDNVALRDRLDWEQRPSSELRAAIHSGLSNFDHANTSLREVDVIVVKDLGKGVVTKKLVEQLIKNTRKNVDWYVSSKDWKPQGWYDSLPSANVKLFLIPQLAARQAIRTEQIATSSWITVGGVAAEEAMTAINGIAEDFPNADVVVLPVGMKVLARDSNLFGERNKGPRGYFQIDPGNAKFTDTVPMASVFFPTLVTRMLQESEPLREMLQHALNFTDHWMRREYGRIVEDHWCPKKDQSLNIEREFTQRYDFRHPTGWENQYRHWKDSRRQLGIVNYQTEEKHKLQNKLQLWRGMTEVGEYVSCVPKKRKVLKTLVELGRQFYREPEQHMAFLLIDAPGSGKSYLASRLAKEVGMRYLPFNITQMLSRQDLLYAFDTIVTTQAQNPDERLLVFVDEINAPLEGRPPYDAFLAPLEDGIYIRAGNAFHIAPCFWVFAGTDRPRAEDKQKRDRVALKGSDFESRLNNEPFELSADENDETDKAMTRLENVYIAGVAIRRFYPDVREVSQLVLETIHHLPWRFGPRDIAQFVKRFREVQYGRVTSRNLPPDWHKFDDHIVKQGFIDQVRESRLNPDSESLVALQASPDDDIVNRS